MRLVFFLTNQVIVALWPSSMATTCVIDTLGKVLQLNLLIEEPKIDLGVWHLMYTMLNVLRLA